MPKSFLMIGVLAALLMLVSTTHASSPAIKGEISGVELCPQFFCDAAVFNGTCDCEVDGRHTIGFFWVAVEHHPLPAELSSAAIFGGKWNLTTLRGSFSGRVLNGWITNNGNNTFDVTATLRLRKGGNGDVTVSGVLDHTEFPPTLEGKLLQPQSALDNKRRER